MSIEQPDLPLFPRRRVARDRTADLAKLVTWLRGRDWQTAAQIESSLGFADRYTRQLASESQGQIISGQTGYRLTIEATLPEIQHARDWLLSQAREMERRVAQIDRIRHARLPLEKKIDFPACNQDNGC